MRNFIFSASIIAAALPGSFAAPAIPPTVVPSTTTLNPEWWPVNKTYTTRAAGSRVLNTNSTRGDETDPSAQYIIIMKDEETREWSDVFDDMGFSTKELKRSVTARSASGDNIINGFRTFEIDDGSHIKAFGTRVRGFTMEMLESEAESMGTLDNVKHIEKDQIYVAGVIQDRFSYSKGSGVDRAFKPRSKHVKRQEQSIMRLGNYSVETKSPWNLQRISEKNRIVGDASREPKNLDFNYVYEGLGGLGVDVYMVDSGINPHVGFGNRRQMIYTAYEDNFSDDNGHGTHTAGTVGSWGYGVAKNVTLLGVKVLNADNSGTGSGIVAGLEAALNSHLQRRNNPDFRGSVISMSIGGGGSQAQRDILQRITEAGMHVSLSAMNDNTDACKSFPGGYSRDLPIFNVGATDINDNKASFSNYGDCVNIHAPGVDIVSASNEDPKGTKIMEGTSMACPAVSGVIALELVKHPELKFDPKGMRDHIISMGLKNVVGGVNTEQRLLNNGFQGQV